MSAANTRSGVTISSVAPASAPATDAATMPAKERPSGGNCLRS